VAGAAGGGGGGNGGGGVTGVSAPPQAAKIDRIIMPAITIRNLLNFLIFIPPLDWGLLPLLSVFRVYHYYSLISRC
jgi:hypothetical protein